MSPMEPHGPDAPMAVGIAEIAWDIVSSSLEDLGGPSRPPCMGSVKYVVRSGYSFTDFCTFAGIFCLDFTVFI